MSFFKNARNLIFISYFLFSISYLSAQIVRHLPNAHAHNDYEKPRPALFAALRQGFVSIEIDVFAHGKKNDVRVSHIPLFVGWKPRLEKQYFQRLEQWLAQHPSFFQDSTQRLIFMIDVKGNGEEVYRRLRLICQQYEHLLTVRYPRQDSVRYGKVEILLSGSKPYEAVKNDTIQYMFLDGGFGNIGDPVYTPQLAPRVSSSYRGHFKWRGKRKQMPEKEHQKLLDLVARAHADKRTIRFWAMPDNERVWSVFAAAGVDWLNVDKIKKFRKWHHKLHTNHEKVKDNNN